MAVVEPYRDQPCRSRLASAELLDRQRNLLVLVGRLPSQAVTRETDDKDECIIGNRFTDAALPVLTRPQVRSVTPHRNPSSFEHVLQAINLGGVLAHVR